MHISTRVGVVSGHIWISYRNAAAPHPRGYSDAAAKTACKFCRPGFRFLPGTFFFYRKFQDRPRRSLVRLVARGRQGGSIMDLDPVLLSRLQFAWVIGWHILLPAFTVGMASYIAILEGMHLVTGRS